MLISIEQSQEMAQLKTQAQRQEVLLATVLAAALVVVQELLAAALAQEPVVQAQD